MLKNYVKTLTAALILFFSMDAMCEKKCKNKPGGDWVNSCYKRILGPLSVICVGENICCSHAAVRCGSERSVTRVPGKRCLEAEVSGEKLLCRKWKKDEKIKDKIIKIENIPQEELGKKQNKKLKKLYKKQNKRAEKYRKKELKFSQKSQKKQSKEFHDNLKKELKGGKRHEKKELKKQYKDEKKLLKKHYKNEKNRINKL